MRTLLHLKRLPWIVALAAAGALPSLAQQPDDLQKQLEQLKQQYDCDDSRPAATHCST